MLILFLDCFVELPIVVSSCCSLPIYTTTKNPAHNASYSSRLEDMKDQLRKRMFTKHIVRIASGLSIELNTYALIHPTTPDFVMPFFLFGVGVSIGLVFKNAILGLWKLRM